MLIHKREGTHGFTIVELLIVVVIIAILAAITLVTYSGIQQRANNAAIIDAASKSVRMIQAYIAANGTYPQSGGSGSTWGCVTTGITCTWSDSSTVPASSTLSNNMATIGTLPKTVPISGTAGNGIQTYWSGSFTLNGTSEPFIVNYWLIGTNKQCGVPGTVTYNGNILSPSSSGYTNGNEAGGKTKCSISVDGPGV